MPNSYPLEFDELESLKELFEFLLQFITMLCKFFYGDENGNVDLTKFTKNDFLKINTYMLCIGFSSEFHSIPATTTNLDNANNNRYDRKCISVNPNILKLKDLMFGLKCKQNLYIISFDFISMS